jgi:hypothetical protein
VRTGIAAANACKWGFVWFVFFFRDLYVDVFTTSLLAFAACFAAEAIAGSFFVVGLGVVLVE